MQSKARRVSIRNSETHGSIISGTQDVTNRGEPMSFADSLLKPLRQAPVLGKKTWERTLPHDWSNPRNIPSGMEVGKSRVLSSEVANRGRGSRRGEKEYKDNDGNKERKC